MFQVQSFYGRGITVTVFYGRKIKRVLFGQIFIWKGKILYRVENPCKNRDQHTVKRKTPFRELFIFLVSVFVLFLCLKPILDNSVQDSLKEVQWKQELYMTLWSSNLWGFVVDPSCWNIQITTRNTCKSERRPSFSPKNGAVSVSKIQSYYRV